MNEIIIPQRTVLTVRQFSAKHPAFSQPALRNLIFHASARRTSRGEIAGNGLGVALIRLGSKILIDEARFFDWLDQQQIVVDQRRLGAKYG